VIFEVFEEDCVKKSKSGKEKKRRLQCIMSPVMGMGFKWHIMPRHQRVGHSAL
jgi:hypothetical protein